MRIKHRMLAAVMAPLLVLSVLSIGICLELGGRYRAATAAAHASEAAGPINAAVDALQVERGVTSGMMSSPDRSVFQTKVAKARAATDTAVSALERARQVGTRDSAMGQALDAAFKRIEALSALRARADTLESDRVTVVRDYTGTIDGLIRAAEKIDVSDLGAETVAAVNAYSALMRGKEAAGQERAAAVAGFAAQQFAADVLAKMRALEGEQRAWLNDACHARPAVCGAVEALETSTVGASVISMRATALTSVSTGEKAPVTGPQWFDAATARITRLGNILETENMTLQVMAHAAARQALTSLLAAVGFTLIGGGAVLLICHRVCLSVLKPLGQQTDAMRKLANGDIEIEIPGRARRDEFAAMASALTIFQSNERARRDAEAQRERERAQAAEALDLARVQAQAVSEAAVNSVFGSALRRLAEGDLTSRIEGEVPQAFIPLQADFNSAAETLGATMSRLMVASSGVSAASGEIRSAADDLARRTEIQAASLEEAAAALHEVNQLVTTAATSAGAVSTYLCEMRSVASNARDIVRDTSDAVSGIERSANEISKIIGVIDEIAFQTNLLALNAGVEAARAGESGRGFAVVAQEVRALAQRSAEAAREIKSLIQDSNTQVQNGVEKASASGQALEEIVGRVGVLVERIHEIAASSREQSASLSQVTQAISELDGMTQHNAAMVEEATAAANTLEREAGGMDEMMSAFVVRDGLSRRAAA